MIDVARFCGFSPAMGEIPQSRRFPCATFQLVFDVGIAPRVGMTLAMLSARNADRRDEAQ